LNSHEDEIASSLLTSGQGFVGVTPFFMTVPVPAAAPPAVSMSTTLEGKGTNLTSQLTKALGVGEQIESCLQINPAGQVTLSPAASSGLNAQTLAVAESGIDQLNDWLSEDAYQVSEVKGILRR